MSGEITLLASERSTGPRRVVLIEGDGLNHLDGGKKKRVRC